MDPAQELELRYLSYQKSMNDVIGRGDSPVQLWYQDATVFLTGGAGFIGKQLIEKLFRSCAIKKMYLLLRSKKGRTINDRLSYMLKDPVFDLVRQKKPQFAERIIPVEGNVADIRLGLNEHDWTKLTQEVDTVFHLAATVQFEAPLREATLTNIRGTREIITLSRECSNLKTIVHVSTAYTCATKDRVNEEVFEQFYPSPVTPDLLISLAEGLEEKRFNGIDNENLYDGWPNSYTFTKAVAEDLIRTAAKDLPISIVRPPVVIAAHTEPAPGWMDLPSAVSGTNGIILGLTIAAIHTILLKKYVGIAKTPVDYVNNAIIGAGWDANERRKSGNTKIPIYTVTDKDNYLYTDSFSKVLTGRRELTTDKAIYLCSAIECHNEFTYWVLSWLFHYIPAYFMDIVCGIIGKRPKQIKSFVGIYKKFDKMAAVYDYFMTNEWQFNIDNLVAMRNRMSEADKEIFNCDVSRIDFNDFLLMWGIGARKYIIKDGINNTIYAGKKQRILQVVNYFVLPLYIYLVWTVLYFCFTYIKYAVDGMVIFYMNNLIK